MSQISDWQKLSKCLVKDLSASDEANIWQLSGAITEELATSQLFYSQIVELIDEDDPVGALEILDKQ